MPARYLKPRNPYNPLLAVCVVGGILSLISPNAVADSVARTLPHWASYAWAAGLCLSSATALFGSWRAGLHGANIERLGLSLLCGICAIWGVAVVCVNPAHGWGAGMFYAGFAATNFLRIRVLNLALALACEELADGS